MCIGILETDDSYMWQPQVKRQAAHRLRLDAEGLKCMSSQKTLTVIQNRLETFPARFVFLGSGAFHHLSLPLIARLVEKTPLSVFIFDQHADLFPSPEGFITCGSWVREVIKLPGVRRVVIGGVAEGIPNLDEKVIVLTAQSWQFFFKRRKSYFEELMDTDSLYLSIDKDVFSETNTDWGKGKLSVEEVIAFLQWCLKRWLLVGADVCGETVPRGPWPTLQEQRSIAQNEKINLILCQVLTQQDKSKPHGHSRSQPVHLRPTA
ncbi:MAG: arginase family protein [Thermacetogeniaceae bacterium]